MNTIWVVVGAAVAGLVAVVAVVRARGRSSGTSYPDHGAVSASWLAEQTMADRDRFSS
jgi:hypothetical protein